MNRLRRSYDLLGLSPDASALQIRRAYRDLVRLWHPDLFPHDPRLQLRAQEKLKEINEAHQLVLAALADRQGAPHPEPVCTEPEAPPPQKSGGRRRQPAPGSSPAPGYPATAVFPFFSAWQNLLFLLLVVGTVYFVNLKYGNLFRGAAYALRMLAIPLAFSLACNTCWGNRRLLWKGYLAVVGVCGALLVGDAVIFSAGMQGAATYRYSPSRDGGGSSYFGDPAGSPASFSGNPWQPSPIGPLAPASPVVSSPSAPMAPSAPTTPASPSVHRGP